MMNNLIPVKYKIKEYNNIFIEERNENCWAITMNGFCLNKIHLDFEYEPQPSSRTVQFLTECRFDSLETANYFLNEYLRKIGK